MRYRTGGACLATAYLILATSGIAQEAPKYAGPTPNGFLLPNGWVVSPAGAQVTVTDLPLNILPLEDNRHALVATSGYNAHELSLIDLQDRKVVDSQTVRESWFGLAATPQLDRIWWSGGGANTIHRFRLDGRKLARPGESTAGEGKGDAPRGKTHFQSGLALDAARNVLYALDP